MKAWIFIDNCVPWYPEIENNGTADSYSIPAHRPISQWMPTLVAYPNPLNALNDARGQNVCRVECCGDLLRTKGRVFPRHLKVLWKAPALAAMHRFGHWAIRHTPIGDGTVVWDLLPPECKAAVEASERYHRGETDIEPAMQARWVAMDVAKALTAHARAIIDCDNPLTSAMRQAEDLCEAANAAVQIVQAYNCWSVGWGVRHCLIPASDRRAAAAAQTSELKEILEELCPQQ